MMESIEHLQRQLASLDELRTIVKTMKALSAASIRQYEKAVISLTDYYHTVELGLQVVLQDSKALHSSPQDGHVSNRMAAIVFGTDHGLCGRFNEDIANYAIERMGSSPADPENRLIITVGARVASSLEQSGQIIEENLPVAGAANRITATVQQILLRIEEWREQANVNYVYLFYNRHSGKSGYQPTGIELLPVNLRRFNRLKQETWPSRSLPTFTMERERLLTTLLRQYFFVSIFRACAESQASEHGSRLAAMQTAERNLDERKDEVTTIFRRARQNAITSELMDVVAGFEVISDNNP